MNMLAFVVWMLLYPMMDDISKALKYKYNVPVKEYSQDEQGLIALVSLIIYALVGMAIWHKIP